MYRPTTRRPAALALGGLFGAGLAVIAAVPAAAQPFDPGPRGTVTGSSMAGARIGNYRPALGGRIGGAEVFGDTVEERVYGRAYDDRFLRPRVRVAPAEAGNALRATQGRSDLNGVNAGAYARGEANIGTSPVTRPSLGGRRAIIRR